MQSPLSFAFRWLLPLFAALIVLYWAGLHGPFLFDDAPNIVDNAFLSTPGDSLLDWWSAAQSSGAGVLRRPLVMLSFAAEHAVHGSLDAFALKALNLLIHCACGALILLLLRWLLAALPESELYRDWLPLVAAAIWLVNPLLLSTVLYPVQRMAQMATLFVLAGLCAYAFYRTRWAARGARPDEVLALLLWLLFFTIMALLCKENGLLLPWLVAVIEVTLLRGLWNGRVSARIEKLGALLFALPVIAVIALLVWQWDWVLAGYSYRDFDLSQRLWTQARLLWSYLSWFTLPQIQAMGLFHDDLVVSRGWWDPITTLVAIVAWVGVLIAAIALRRRFAWLLMGLLFYLVGHSLESGFLALELVFEHRNYLPSVGVAIALGASLLQLGDRLSAAGSRRLVALPCVLWLVLAAAVLAMRAQSWGSELALASASVSRHPESSRAAHFYANTLIKERNAVGVNVELADQYLSLARHEFERLYLENRDDLSALVMLYTLDVRYFPELGDPQRWLPRIESTVARVSLKATEYAAMRVLLACAVEGACSIPAPRLHALLESFGNRFVYTHGSAELKLYAMDTVAATPAQRIELLEDAIERSPRVPSLYYPLVSAWLELRNYAAAHRVIAGLLQQDEQYRQLAAVDALFRSSPGGGSPGDRGGEQQ